MSDEEPPGKAGATRRRVLSPASAPKRAHRPVEPESPESLEAELKQLAADWKRTRGVASSIARLAMLPPYQRIVGKGRDAIPFLLRELTREPDHWFWALTAITGENPVPEQAEGDLQAMARAWIAWGTARGYL